MDDGAQIEQDLATDWDGALQPAPDYEVVQRITWRQVKAVTSQALWGAVACTADSNPAVDQWTRI